MTIVQRPGAQVIYIPGDGLGVRYGRTRSYGVPWWLSGGIAPANCVAAYQPKGAASLAASYTNLANPGTYNAAPGVAPTWAVATGWTFNGINQYLTTGVVAQSGWSIFVQFSSIANANVICGSYNGFNTRFYLQPAGNVMTQVIYASGQPTAGNPQLLAGNIGMAGQRGYRNGVIDGAVMGAWSGANTIGIAIGCRNSAGAYNQLISGNVLALAIYDVTITASQITALTTAMAAL